MALKVQLFLSKALAAKVLAKAHEEGKTVPKLLLEILNNYFCVDTNTTPNNANTTPNNANNTIFNGALNAAAEEKPLATNTVNPVVPWRSCAHHTRREDGGLWCSRRKKYLSANLTECKNCNFFKLPPLPQIHP